MKCPYCAEEIKDEARVCRYCGRDFYLLGSITERLHSLEDQLAEITRSLQNQLVKITLSLEDQKKRFSAASPADPRIDVSLLAYSVAFLPVVTAVTVFYWLFCASKHEQAIWLWASILAPFPAGLWLGVVLKGRHVKSYVFTGLLAGCTASIIAVGCYQVHSPGLPTAEWLKIFGVYALAATVLFSTGGLFGDWIEFTRLHVAERTGLSERLALKLTRARGKQVSWNDARVKRVAGILRALEPALAAIASILSAWLTAWLASPAPKN